MTCHFIIKGIAFWRKQAHSGKVGVTHANLKTARAIHPVETKIKTKVKTKVKAKVKTLVREKVGSIHGLPLVLLLLRRWLLISAWPTRIVQVQVIIVNLKTLRILIAQNAVIPVARRVRMEKNHPIWKEQKEEGEGMGEQHRLQSGRLKRLPRKPCLSQASRWREGWMLLTCSALII